MRGSASGGRSPRPGSGGRARSRSHIAPAAAATRSAAASTASAARRPLRLRHTGSTSAAIAPPSGTPVWRMPSASPRCDGATHPRPARPLAAWTHAPRPPAAKRAIESATTPFARAAATTATEADPRPAAITARSPTRSASMPHGSTVASTPRLTLARTTPTPSRLRWKCDWSSGASTGSPRKRAAKLVWTPTPVARIVHRYGSLEPAVSAALLRQVARLGEDPPHHRLEELDRQRLVRRVEAVLVVALAELDARVKVGAGAELLAHVRVGVVVLGVVVHLEGAVMADDPADLLRDVRPQDRPDHLAVGV